MASEFLSLQLQYEQVCQREREANLRNSSFKRDITRVRRKLADLNLEIKTKRLLLLKNEYQESVYSTWLAETCFLNSQTCDKPGLITSQGASSFSHPPDTPTSFTLPELCPGSVTPLLTNTDPSLHRTTQVPPVLPLQSTLDFTTNIMPSSAEVHTSSFISPISHPAPYVLPSSVSGVKPPLPLSSQSRRISSTVVTSTWTTATSANSIQVLAKNNEAPISSDSQSKNVPLYEPLPVPLPEFSDVPLNDSGQQESSPQGNTSLLSTSSLLSSTNTSLCISSQNVADNKDEESVMLKEVVLPTSLKGMQPTQEQDLVDDGEEEISEDNELEMEGANKVIRIDIPRQEKEYSQNEEEWDSESEGEQEVGKEHEDREKENQNATNHVRMDLEEEKLEPNKSDAVLGESMSDIDFSSLSDLSLPGWDQNNKVLPPGSTSEQHMSAYYKLVGKCSNQDTLPALSQSSEESDLEGNLRLAVTQSVDSDNKLRKDNHVVPGKIPVLVQGLIDGQDNNILVKNVLAIDQKPTLPSLAKLSEEENPAVEVKKLLVDDKSLKRRMGLVSSSDDESDNSIAAGVLAKFPLESKGDSIIANIANEIDEDDDDDFDFYS